MKNNFKKFFLTVFLSLIFLFNFNIVNAALVNCGRSVDKPCTIDDLFNLNGGTSNSPFWINLIQTALGISGIIILCVFVYSGFTMMISGGETKKIEKARKMMIGSFMGIIIVFFSFTIVKAGLIILVGDKWSIYFGNNNINSIVTDNTNNLSCNNDSNCRSGEYCCIGNKYDLNGTKCNSSQLKGKCLSKKKSSTSSVSKCSDNAECKSGKCEDSSYCGCISVNDCLNSGDFCCNSDLRNYGVTCSKINICNTNAKFKTDPVTKIGDINNGDSCADRTGKCIYIKKNLIDSNYYPTGIYPYVASAWNFNDSDCGVNVNKCTDSNTICLRCIRSDIYTRISQQ